MNDRRLMGLLKPHGWRMGAAMILGAGTVGGNIGLLATSAYLISQAALHPELYVLTVAIVGVRFFGISRAILRYGERYLSHDVTFRLLSVLRVWAYRSLEPMAPAWPAGYRSGDFLSRLIADIETLKFYYLKVVAPPCIAVLVAALTAVWLSFYHWLFAVILIGGFVLIGMAVPWISHYRSRKHHSEIFLRAAFQAKLADCIGGLTEIVAFHQEDRQLERVARLSRACQQARLQSGREKTLADVLGFLIAQLTMVCGLGTAVFLVSTGRLSGIDVAVVVLGLSSAFEAVLPLAQFTYYQTATQTAADRLFETSDVVAPQNGIYAPRLAVPSEISFQKVSFCYPQSTSASLKNLTLTIRPGEKVAIVGPSGAGKTTLVHLLLRFFDVQEGKILFDGQSIRDWNLEKLRDSFGVIAQRTHLFDASLRDNILLARPTATLDELMAAVTAANLATVVNRREGGLNADVGPDGQALSGGERQRVAIARILLKDAPVVICDEATNGLDSVTEQEILSEMERLFQKKTVITVTHNLLQLTKQDRIYVLYHQEVVESGTEQELLEQQGLFYRMYWLQREMICDRNFSDFV